jgi:hypothetical protein
VAADRDEPRAVFLFYTDGSGVDVYRSLDSAQGDIEAVDVDDDAYKLFTDDGQVVEARTGGRFGQDVRLQITENRQPDELVTLLREALPQVGLDFDLASSPVAAAEALFARGRRRHQGQ